MFAVEATVASSMHDEDFRWANQPEESTWKLTASGLFPCKYSQRREQKKRQLVQAVRKSAQAASFLKMVLFFFPKIFPGCGTSHMLQGAVSSVERLEELKIKIDFQRTKSDLTTQVTQTSRG